jgi:hypothetical protein
MPPSPTPSPRLELFIHTGGIFSVFGFREGPGPRLPPASV